MGEGDKGEGQKYELPNRRAVTKFHHPRLIARRAHHRDDGLQQSYAKGEDKGDMSEFGAHMGARSGKARAAQWGSGVDAVFAAAMRAYTLIRVRAEKWNFIFLEYEFADYIR